MKKYFVLALILLGMVFTPGVIATTPSGQTAEVNATAVTVGLLTPQTGGLSAYSAGFENAAKLAIKDLGADTAFSDYTFTLKVYDTQTSTDGSSAGMTQAVNDGVTYMVGAAGSSNTMAAAAVAKANNVPMISYASTSPEITKFDDGDMLFRTPPSDSLQGQVLADLADAAGYTTMVIVTLDNAYGAGLAESTKAAFEAAGGTVATTIKYDETATDFSATVSSIKAEEPDVVVAISYATDGSLLFTEMSTQKANVQVIGADGVADVGIFDETDGTQDAMQGFMTVKPSAVASAEATAFADAYKAEYPSASGDIYTGETYDAVMAGARAVKDAGSTDGTAIAASLHKISFAGATGTISFDDNGDSSAGFYSLMYVEGAEMNEKATWEGGSITWTDSDFETAWKDNATGVAPAPFPLAAFFSSFALAAVVLRKRKN